MHHMLKNPLNLLNRFNLAAAGVLVVTVSLAAQIDKPKGLSPQQSAATQQKPVASPAANKPVAAHAPATATMLPAEQTALVKQYCAGCHSDRGKAGNLSLAAFDAAKIEDNGELTEKMIRKLRAGM